MIREDDLYPTRKGEKEMFLPRQDPVVYGDEDPDTPYSLNTRQLGAYEKDGYLILPDYMPEMVQPLREEVQRLSHAMQGREELISEPGSNELRTIFKPFAFSELIDTFSRNPKVLNIVKQILGSDVYLTQSRINVKPGLKGKSFPWHSDFETWHSEDGMPRMRALSAWIMLSENNEFNGPLYLIPGSHKTFISCAGETANENYNTSLKFQETGVPGAQSMKLMLEKHIMHSVHGKPGTVVFHECNLLHGSPDNISLQDRTNLMFVYNSCENTLVAPFCDQPPRPHFLRNTDTTALK